MPYIETKSIEELKQLLALSRRWNTYGRFSDAITKLNKELERRLGESDLRWQEVGF
jgi:hypothetical protein